MQLKTSPARHELVGKLTETTNAFRQTVQCEAVMYTVYMVTHGATMSLYVHWLSLLGDFKMKYTN